MTEIPPTPVNVSPLQAESFRLLVESVQDYAIYFLTPDGYISSWNPGAQRIKGYAAREAIGQHVSLFYTPEDRSAGIPTHELEIAAKTGRFEGEGWRVRKDGKLLWVNVVLTAIRDVSGRLIGFGKVTRDLTERKQTEEHLQQSEERMHLLVESVKDYAIFMLDPSGCVMTWNPGAERLKGYKAHEIIGKHFSNFYPPDVVATGKCEWELEEAIKHGRVEDEGWRVRKDGSRFWANVVISAVRDAKGTLVGFAKVTRDLTERKRAEETRVQLAQADEALRLRDEFLSVASHELRTPLTPLSMQLQSIERALQSGKQIDLKMTAKARRQVARLGRLIDDLLDFSRIQDGRLELDREDFTLNQLLHSVADDFRDVSAKHRITVRESDQVTVRADHARIEQVVVNLIQNAIKYSPSGGEIAVQLVTEGDEARVTVTDQGIGIPLEDQQNLFQRFFRARNATSRNYGGLGLGLYLSYELVRRHGGRFTVESVPGKGSSFSFFLPRITVTAQINQGSSRVLVVDDDQDILEGMQDFLKGEGYTVEVAQDGQKALELTRATRPDVLIVDLMMPILDGAGLIEKLRQEEETARIPIVVFSADRQVYAKATNLRANGAMRKPIDFIELQEVLKRVLAQTTHQQRTVQ